MSPKNLWTSRGRAFLFIGIFASVLLSGHWNWGIQAAPHANADYVAQKLFVTGMDREPVEITTALFPPGAEERFAAAVMELEVQASETVVVAAPTLSARPWTAELEKVSHRPRIWLRTHGHHEKSGDKTGAVLAIVRTAYSTLLWVVISDFSSLQTLAMFTLQAATNYSFTYKGYYMNILEFSKQVGLAISHQLGYDFDDTKAYHSFIKYWTGFNVGLTLGAGYLGIVAWEDFINVFSEMETYRNLAFYSLINLFAAGGWHNFLSEQKFAVNPVLNRRQIQRIYQANGVLLAVAFPLMIHGQAGGSTAMFASGVGLLSLSGLSGLLAASKGAVWIRAWRGRGRPLRVCRSLFD